MNVKAKQKKLPKVIPFSPESILLIEKITLTEYSFIREIRQENGTVSSESMGENLPNMRVVVFIQSSMSPTQRERILNLLKTILAASQVKVFYISDKIDAMFSLNSYSDRKIFNYESQQQLPVYFSSIQQVINSTSPQMSLLFSVDKYITDSLLCFQVKKNEIIFTSKDDNPMELCCEMYPSLDEDCIYLDLEPETEDI